MSEKVVPRVPGTAFPKNDLTALVDLIEVELDLSTGRKSLRNRLSKLIVSGEMSARSEGILQDAVRRLEKIEELLRSLGFETARDSSQG